MKTKKQKVLKNRKAGSPGKQENRKSWEKDTRAHTTAGTANCIKGLSSKCMGVAATHRTEVIASRSELLSLHCPRHLLLLALLPACAVSQVIMRQDCSTYAKEPLRTVGLLEAAHQYSVQDIHGSVVTPTHT